MGLAFAGMLMASCADSPTAVADYHYICNTRIIITKTAGIDK